MESTKFTKVTPQNACVHCGCCKNGFGRRLSGKLFSAVSALLHKPTQKSAQRSACAGGGGAPRSAAAGCLARAGGHHPRAAVGPIPPPRPALSSARTDTGSGPRWGRSLRRGRLARARARKKIRENGIATPTSLDIPSQNARRSLREKFHS